MRPLRPLKRTIRIEPAPISGEVRGTWLWEADRITDPTLLVNQLRAGLFTEIYVPYREGIPDADWKAFISLAHDNRIDVHALDGDPTWALPAGRDSGLSVIDKVTSYNNRVEAQERFVGLQMDVEAYLTAEWGSGPEGIRTTSISWVDNMQAFALRARAGGLKFGGAFPYWLENVPEADPSISPLHIEFLDMVDYYAVMSYADNPQTVISYARDEIEAVTQPMVLVSIETTPQQPSSVTFYEEGYQAVLDAITTIDEHYKDALGYLGIAVHMLPQFIDMQADYLPRAFKTGQPIKATRPLK